MPEMVDERCALAQDYGTSVAMEKTLMENSATAIGTVGLLVGAAQSDTIYRDVYLRRARPAQLYAESVTGIVNLRITKCDIIGYKVFRKIMTAIYCGHIRL